MELKTPLYDAHVKAGGKIVPFAGYLLTGTVWNRCDHRAYGSYDTQAGLFDVSHMGEVFVPGKRCTCKPAAAADK